MNKDGMVEVGDVVEVNSGGPTMVVESVDKPIVGIVRCVWFNKEDHAQHAEFRLAMLRFIKGKHDE